MRIAPRPHVPGYFWIRNFFFPDSKMSPSTRNVFKSNSPVHTHTMVSGFTLEKLVLHVGLYWLLFSKTLDMISFCYIIEFVSIRIHRSHVIGFVTDLFFSTLDSWFKIIRIRCRIRRTRGDRSHIRKEKSCGFKYIRIRVEGALLATTEGVASCCILKCIKDMAMKLSRCRVILP